jgi:hypothetical protein
MIRLASAAVACASASVACAALAGCGAGGSEGGPTKHFESQGFGITFDYPIALSEKDLRDNASSEGAPGKPDVVVRELTITDDDFIAVRRDPMDPALLASPSAALEPEVNQLAKVLDSNVGPGRPITVGGMPGFEYLDSGPDAQHRFLFFVGPDVLYLVHCKSTPAHRAEIADACATVERTVHKA